MALNIAPSEYWDGNDGPWSTFNLNVGTQAQKLRVLPVTSQSVVWVVLEQGCPSQYPGNCPSLRGNIFDPSPSKDISWSPQQPTDGQAYFAIPHDSESSLPDYQDELDVEAGVDTISLDWSGKDAPLALNTQVVAGFAAELPWLGVLGLSGRPSHIFNYSTTEYSPLQSLVANDSISGLYWAYTAGKRYANPPLFGSLTLGGYDAARVNLNSSIVVGFGSDSTRDLLVAVTHITISASTTITVSGLPILTLIDSFLPEIWLPKAACAAFESALGLAWNDTLKMYLINDTQHANLISQNPIVTFYLAANTSSSAATQITLPYAAFDLSAQFPLAGIQDNATSLKYFPLKQADNSSQYYLGRTFLQEAYVMADYNKSQFTVAPALTPAQPTSSIVAAYQTSSHKNSLSAGAIAGIAIGAVAVVALVVGLLLLRWWQRRKKQRQVYDTSTVRTASLGDTTIVGDTEVAERENVEFFKPPPPDGEFYKPELDARDTATGFVGHYTDRHELDAGSIRPSHRTQLSWGSAGSGVSPLGEDRVRSMMGEPSPPLNSGSSSPPGFDRFHERQRSAGSPRGLFEMS